MIKRGERRLKRRRDAALRAVQAGLIIAMGATQNAMAMASVGATKLEKAIRMANICLEVGEGLRKIYAEENEIKA